ncbi:MAG: polysaccharide biosynthesis protein [Bacillota bacterium]|nr:polysaccharide biosynthesis protein [Bacillota bacterium]
MKTNTKGSADLGQSVIKGSLILVIANLLVKVIGAMFKIPLTNLIGNRGMGYFSSAYTIYSGLFTVATAGLPVAIAKMIAESTQRKSLRELKRIHYISYIIFAIVGVVGASILYLGADKFMKQYGDNSICIRLIAPALFFVAIMSVYRGFFQGLSDMYPTAISELIESSVKLIAGYSLAYIFLKKGLVYGAAGGVSGVTLGSVLGSAFLIMAFFIKRKKIYSSLDPNIPSPSRLKIFTQLMYVALPVTISASVFTITNLIDVFQTGRRLTLIADKLPLAPVDLYGMYTSKAVTMLNLPPALVVALCLPLVPAIARAYTAKDMPSVSYKTYESIKFTIIFALPCSVGLALLADPVLRTLYGTNDAATLLRLISPAIVFVSLVLVTNAILQATGNVLIPVLNIAIAGITKVIINYFLLVIPAININGVAIGSSVCYFIYMVLNLFYVSKVTKTHFSMRDFIAKPLVSSAAMGVVVLVVNRLLTSALGTSRLAAIICTGASVCAGGIIYMISLFKTSTLTKDELIMLPKGDKIISIAAKIRLIKE